MAISPNKKGDIMALIDYKIKPSDVGYQNVQNQEGRVLRGTVAQNKLVFDQYPELIKDKFNALIDFLISVGASVPATDESDGLMTAEDKAKLDTVEENAEPNVLEGIKFDGVEQTITDKKVNIPTFTSPTEFVAGKAGFVPAPAADTENKVLFASGWGDLEINVLRYANYVNVTLAKNNVLIDYDSIGAATQSMAGVMSAADKTKLDTIILSGGMIDPSMLPSYVDDVIETYPRSGQTELTSTWLSLTNGGSALTPETGKIYVLLTASTNYPANSQFRWSGTAYVELLADNVLKAESWATGQRGGVDVDSSDPTYHNNAKYYAEQAHDDATDIENYIGRSNYLQLGIDEDGHLVCLRSDLTDITFVIDEDGHLIVEEIE